MSNKNTTLKFVPWTVAGLMVLWILSSLRFPAPTSEFNSLEFGRLPVLLNGRIQPLDSVARNSLVVIRGTQNVRTENRGEKIKARDWLLQVAYKPESADNLKVFRIHHPELIGELNLKDEGGLQYFSFNDLKGQFEVIENQAERAQQLEAQQRDPFQKSVVSLHHALGLYQRLKNSFRPERVDDFQQYLVDFEASIGPGVEAAQNRERGADFSEESLNRLLEYLHTFDFVSNVAYPLIIPPNLPDEDRKEWKNLGTALLGAARSDKIPEPATYYARLSHAYRDGNAAEFNQTVDEYQRWLVANDLVPEIKKGGLEVFFNHYQPFYKSVVLYVLAFVIACFFWVTWAPPLRLTALLMLTLALVVHSSGILFRMALEGRPPVTNLYSSAVFVGWGAVVLGLILERIFRDGIGLVAASLVGFVTLIIAHNLSLGGDTMEMLQAVLDTNIWLATHVVVITLGYSAMFFAGFLAIVYVLRGVFTRSLKSTTAKSLTRMVYGIVCFATLFSFVGTILGGIWADQSWGRFWGWDPKENGALLIVLWCAMILHARWGGMIRERGLMAMAIFGNIVTAFSWFGVNMLGVGLHSYGFMDKAFKWLMLFNISQLALIALAVMPIRYWLSFRDKGRDRDSESGNPVESSLPKPDGAAAGA